ncbi:MAG: TIGR02281 family clan AA aspartic protease [Gammaproteobacteria bacterium]
MKRHTAILDLPRYLFLLFVGLGANTAVASDIAVLGLFSNMAIIKVDGQQYKLRQGEATPQGIKLLSADSDAATFLVNGQRQTLSVGTTASISTHFDKRAQVEARIMRQHGMYSVAGSVNKQPVSFLVDTGATWVAMNSATARRLGIDFRYVGTPGWANTANGPVKTYKVKLDSVRVGEIELTQVEGAVLEGGSPQDILLGMSFLNRVEMQREGELLVLRKKW